MRKVALLIVVFLVCAPASIAAAAPPRMTATTQLSPTAQWLTQPRTVAVADTTARGPDLPYTGDNLLPEAIAAVVLIAAGVAIRFRPRWQ